MAPDSNDSVIALLNGAHHDSESLVTPKEAARLLDVSIVTIRRYVRNGSLKAMRNGRGPLRKRLLIRESDLRALFSEEV